MTAVISRASEFHDPAGMQLTTDGLSGRSCTAPLISRPSGPPGRSDFAQAPFIVIWEVTRACALACVHCRADAIPGRDPHELTTEEGFRLIDQVRAFGDTPPLFVLTGGDPMRRPDLADLVRYGRTRDECRTDAERDAAVTRKRLAELQAAGLKRVAVSLDGPDAEHARRVPRRPRILPLDDEDHRRGDRSRDAAADQHDDRTDHLSAPRTP